MFEGGEFKSTRFEAAANTSISICVDENGRTEHYNYWEYLKDKAAQLFPRFYL